MSKSTFTDFSISNIEVSAVDGNWTSWGSWGECSSSCGTGITSRHRTCTAPAPTGLGKDCIGEASSYEVCVKSACPGKIQYR